MKRSRPALTAIATAATLCAALAMTPFVADGRDDPSAKRGDAVDPRIDDGSEQQRLDRARDRWRDYGVRDYRFRVALQCFCPEEIREPVVIRVRDGRPRAVPSHLRKAATVPRLLRIVQRAIDDRVAGLNVRYGRHGVPRSIGIDSSRAVADEEREYEIDRFWPRKATVRAAFSASGDNLPWLVGGLGAASVILIVARTARRRR